MNTLQRLHNLKEKGFSIKTMSYLSDIKEATIYAYSCKHNKLSKDKEKRLLEVLDRLERLYNVRDNKRENE